MTIIHVVTGSNVHKLSQSLHTGNEERVFLHPSRKSRRF